MSPLTSCLPLHPAPSSFQQRIKQLLTEEWRDWQVKGSFLVRRASVSVGPMSSQNSLFHIPVRLKLTLAFLCCEIPDGFLEPHFSHCTSKMTPVYRQEGSNSWIAFVCDVKFLLCCLCVTAQGALTLPVSSVHQRAATPTVCSRHSSQTRKRSASEEHVGVVSYCIFILSRWLYFICKEGSLLWVLLLILKLHQTLE